MKGLDATGSTTARTLLLPTRLVTCPTPGLSIVAGVFANSTHAAWVGSPRDEAGAAGRPGDALVGLVVGAIIFGGGMYLTYRRYMREAVQNARSAPTSTIEPTTRTRHRAVMTGARTVLVLVLVSLVLRNGFVAAGIMFGNGLAFVGVSSWLSRWEQDNHARLLREPTWRWSGGGGGAWGRGRGIMDPQDFYVLSGDSPGTADSLAGSRTAAV